MIMAAKDLVVLPGVRGVFTLTVQCAREQSSHTQNNRLRLSSLSRLCSLEMACTKSKEVTTRFASSYEQKLAESARDC
jgi:hypothetical protein